MTSVDGILDEVNWDELEMPVAPKSTQPRRFYSEWPLERMIRGGASFALFAVALLLLVWSVGIFKEGLLMIEDPALKERHNDFREITGFDNVTTNGNGVAVCIVDTGIDLSHPDLNHLALSGWRDFINQRDTPYDDEGHGTAMSGILVANNHIPGIARGIHLYVAKAISQTGTGTDEGIANAVDWCREQSVDIISLSLGGAQGIDFVLIQTDQLESAVDRALDDGIFVVAAAGNDGGNDDDGDVASPGSVDDVICVGAIDVDGDIWSNSSIGDNGFNPPENWFPRSDPDMKPELVAPGEKLPVLNAQIGSTTALYAWGSGTSGATVWVTAAIAHLLEHRPDLQHDGAAGGRSTIDDVKGWIQESTIHIPGHSGHDEYYGYGRLQVDALITQSGQA
ncbi:MAG: S8 family serine peptidase [Candidatus Thermoplasmatota archaeon]|nr:S8 family serine peptidase [Candidatus Thermoplasmatota archaeon]